MSLSQGVSFFTLFQCWLEWVISPPYQLEFGQFPSKQQSEKFCDGLRQNPKVEMLVLSCKLTGITQFVGVKPALSSVSLVGLQPTLTALPWVSDQFNVCTLAQQL